MFGFPMVGNFMNLFGGDGSSGAPNLLGGSLPGLPGGDSEGGAAPAVAEGKPDEQVSSAEREKESIASDLAANRAEDAKMDKYTNMIPFAGPFITMGRQNDRKLGALLSSYYRMTTPSDTANPNATVVGGLSGSSFLGRI